MEFSHLIAFNVALIAAIVSPGPALLVAIRTTLNSGRQSGVMIGLGLAMVASLWTLAALLGLEAIFVLFPWAYTLVKTLGAAYLIYIAYGMWVGARDPIRSTDAKAGNAFWRGVMINILNPKSVLFAAAVLVVIFPPGMTMAENALVVVNHLAVETMFYTGLAFAMSSVAVSRAYMRARVYIDRFAACVLGGLGLRLLFSR